jgi:glycosyltransferase involved in cell wall biosynthesis
MQVRKVIVGITVYNKEVQLAKALDDITRLMASNSYQYKAVVVDDGSLDHTRYIALSKNALVFSNQKKQGCSEAFILLLEECSKLNFDILVTFKVDEEYNANDILPLIKEFEKDYSLVLGSRYKKKSPSLGKAIFSKAVSSISGIVITDSQTEMRAISKEVVEMILIDHNHNFAQEQIIKAARQGFRIKEIALNTIDKEDINTGIQKEPYKPRYAIKEWFNILKILRDYSPFAVFSSFSLFFLVIAIIIALVWLINAFVHKFDIDNFKIGVIVLMFILAGIQAIIVAFLADMIKK